MVTLSQRIVICCILFTVFTTLFASIPLTKAQPPTYSVNQEWVKIWINNDASIDIAYNITLTYLSGSPQGIVTVGMPKSGFRIDSVQDLSGNSLSYEDVSQGSFYGIDVALGGPIVLNHPNSFLVYAVVSSFVSPDDTNPGNVGMSFYPTTFSSALGTIENVRVLIVLPEGVTSNEVKYLEGVPFDNVLMDGNNVAVYWERSNWPAAQQLWVGVSFPEEYVTLPSPNLGIYIVIFLALVAIIVIFILLYQRRRKAVYEKPKISIEALGAARGLTAVEAAEVVGLKPVRVLTMILYGMLTKRLIMVKETEPLVKIAVLDNDKKRITTRPLRYYEIDFLKAVEADGSLDERDLARTYLSLRNNVDRKIRGYSRIDTINYYKSIVDKAWTQVTQAATPELKGDALEKNMEWLLMDEHYDEKLKRAFPPDLVILPRPGWWWYWYGPYFPRSSTSTPPSPGAPTEVTPIPAQEWANNVVRGLETTANNIVKNVQDFTNKLIVPQTSQSTRSVRRGSSCVCACASCACACACVGCACACAGGGAR